MIIYNVSVSVEQEIVPDWIVWMKTTHIPDVLSTGKFSNAHLCKLLDSDDGNTFVVQYFANSIGDYEAYIADFAPIMRERSFQQFGNKFVAMRTVMEII